jgi:DNA polymerase III epsilon subunit-like protein
MMTNCVLVFDTETTNLIPKKGVRDLDELKTKYPYIVQFSFFLYNIDTHSVIEMFDEIIKIPENVEISPKSEEIHGISKEMCMTKGVSIVSALKKFSSFVDRSSIIVAHNLEFDENMVQVESLRNNIYSLHQRKPSTLYYCTMLNSIDVCNIEKVNRYGPYKKFPRLEELYYYYFKKKPKSLHDSKIDVYACVRCFFKLRFKYDIVDKNNELKNMYDSFHCDDITDSIS